MRKGRNIQTVFHSELLIEVLLDCMEDNFRVSNYRVDLVMVGLSEYVEFVSSKYCRFVRGKVGDGIIVV